MTSPSIIVTTLSASNEKWVKNGITVENPWKISTLNEESQKVVMTCDDIRVNEDLQYRIKAIWYEFYNETVTKYYNVDFYIMFISKMTVEVICIIPQFNLEAAFYSGEKYYLLHEISNLQKNRYYYFTITVSIKNMQIQQTSFSVLYDDTDLTDFVLKAEGGSVKVHKAILATASPVFRRMLAGEWREVSQGELELPGVTFNTLEHFKRYMYKNEVPNRDTEHLILLSSLYMMPSLEQECVTKLLKTVTADNCYNLIEFAINNKLKTLAIEIFKKMNKCLDVSKIP